MLVARAGLVSGVPLNTVAGMKVTLIGCGGSMPGGRCWPRNRSCINSSG